MIGEVGILNLGTTYLRISGGYKRWKNADWTVSGYLQAGNARRSSENQDCPLGKPMFII